MAGKNVATENFDGLWQVWEYVHAHRDNNANLGEFAALASKVGYKNAMAFVNGRETPLTVTMTNGGGDAQTTKAQGILANIAQASDCERDAILHDGSPFKAFAEQALAGVKAKSQAEIVEEQLGAENAPHADEPGSMPALRAEAKKLKIRQHKGVKLADMTAEQLKTAIENKQS